MIKIEVSTCEQCPFYQRGVLSAIADALAKDDRKTGVCHHRARIHRGPLSWMSTFHIAEPTQAPPRECPLRGDETIIKIASGV